MLIKSIRNLFLFSILFTPLISCSLFKEQVDLLEDQKLVITTIENVKEDQRELVKFVPTEMVPEEFKTTWSDKVIVVAGEEQLIDGGAGVPISLSSERWSWEAVGDLLSAGLTLGATWFPSLLGLEGLLALLFPRKRQNYTNALKNLIPSDGTIKIKEASKDVIRALGWMHSSPKTAEVFKEEVKLNSKA